jgi:hypothetical protein
MRDSVSSYPLYCRIGVWEELSSEIFKISFTERKISPLTLFGLCKGFARHDSWFSRTI